MRDIPRWQHQFLGIAAVPKNIGPLEFQAFFTYSPTERTALSTLPKLALRLGAALQLGFLRMTGRPLDAVKVVPAALLKHIGQQLDLPAPNIATLRAIYLNRIRTLYAHQVLALGTLGFSRATDRQFQKLLPYLRDQATFATSVDNLVQLGKVWLYQHHFVYPGDRPIRDYARQALTESEEGLFNLVNNGVNAITRKAWEVALLKIREDTGRTQLEWLQQAPRRNSLPSMRQRIDRIDFLKGLGIHKVDLSSVPMEKMRSLAQQLYHMRPAKLKQLKDPVRSLRLVCFLKVALMQITDGAIMIGGRIVTRMQGDAYKKAELLEAQAAKSVRATLEEIFERQKDRTQTDAQFRAFVGQLATAYQPARFPSRAAAARWLMSEPNPQLRSLLAEFAKLDLHGESGTPAVECFSYLRELYGKSVTALPENHGTPYKRPWTDLVEGEDRRRALCALEAQTAVGLRRALRSGAIWTDDSESYRNKDELLIDKERWDKNRGRYYAQLNLPVDGNAYFKRLLDIMQGKLEMLAEAVRSGELAINDHGHLSLPRLKAIERSADLDRHRSQLFEKIGTVQFPDLILEMDTITGFSQTILGRTARSEQELLQLYAGMIAHGTSADASTVSLMIPRLSPNQILVGMQWFENKDTLRAANDAIVSYLRQLSVCALWGDGSLASSDMMSIDINRHVYTARIDPKRGTPSIGTYTHVADFWPIVSNEPLFLLQRQVGAAIEGAIRQTEIDIETLAVDTHGYSEFGMCMSDFVGLSLCPRLKNSAERKLFVPRGVAVPDVLRDIVDRNVSTRIGLKRYDDLVRMAASIEVGQCSAITMLSRYGSAAADDQIYRAGVHIGRLIRTNYLCDYFTNPALRRTINRILVHGESVHELQRAICRGTFTKPRGGRFEEVIALTGSLTLMSNLCLSWIATRIQAEIDKTPGGKKEYAWLVEMSPASYHNINLRGTLSFPFNEYRDRRLFETLRAANE